MEHSSSFCFDGIDLGFPGVPSSMRAPEMQRLSILILSVSSEIFESVAKHYEGCFIAV